MSDVTPELVAGRSCDGCTMCCKLLGITALGKPQQVWCTHCDVGKGCRIYPERPAECREFYCLYLLNDDFRDHWKPTASQMVVSYEAQANRIVVHVDADHAEAWRQEPYFSELKRMAVAAARNGAQVVVWQGLEAIVVLPDREKSIGRVGRDQIIVTTEQMGPDGAIYDVIVMDKDDPRFAALKARADRVVDKTGR